MSRQSNLIVAALAGVVLVGIIVVATAAVETNAGALALWVMVLAANAVAAFFWGRWKAVFFVGVAPWLILSIGFDALWILEIVNRDDEREPIPLTLIIIPFGIPTFATAAVCGVALRRSVATAATGR